MPTTDFEGFKKNGTTIPVKDSTARTSISAIEEKIPSDASSSNKLATASDVAAKISSTEKGTNNGVATLGNDGRIPSSQLPSYVDDILEYASTSAFPATGEAGKIYVALDTNKMYRWSGSTYTEVSESVALGETQGTAYEGNKGKANADNITNIQAVIPSDATSSNKLATASDVTAVSDAVSAIKDGTDIDSFSDVESALGDVDSAINGIKDGTNIDSFGDVESALAGKQAILTFDNVPTNGSNNPVKSDGIYDALTAKVSWADAGKSVQKNIAQCIIATKTEQGVTYTVMEDKSINTNGTASVSYNVATHKAHIVEGKIYKLTGCPADGGLDKYGISIRDANGITITGLENVYDFGNGAEFTAPATIDIYLCVRIAQNFAVSNKVFYPMVRLATIADSTYEPYIPDNTELFPRSEQVVLGAKQLLDISKAVWGSLTHSTSEQGRVINFSFSTATTWAIVKCRFATKPNTNYRISAKATSVIGTVALKIQVPVSETNIKTSSFYTEPADFDFDFNSGNNSELELLLFGTVGTAAVCDVTYEDLLITLGTDTDRSFAPFAKTNRELTEVLKGTDWTDATLDDNYVTNGTVKYKIKSGICFVAIEGVVFANTGSNQIVATGLPKATRLIAGTSIPGGPGDAPTNNGFFVNVNSTTLSCHVGKSSISNFLTLSYPVD